MKKDTEKFTKEDYPGSFKNLKPEVRNKAIEISNALIKDEGYEDSRAIPIAISKAKEWADNRGKTIKKD